MTRRVFVDAWDPGYGTSDDPSPEDSGAQVALDLEQPAERWQPVPAPSVPPPSRVLFVDGVRRVDARAWLEDDDGQVRAGLCASWAAGVACCSGPTSEVLTAQVRRGLFTADAGAPGLRTRAGDYPLRLAPDDEGDALSLALQRALAELEVLVAVQARAALPPDEDDLLVVDGPLRGRTQLPRALGLVKSHRARYLPPELDRLVGRLGPGERTPVFRLGTSWDRHTWYLRLPCRPGSPWTGVVRVECAPDLPVEQVVQLAGLSAASLCRYASVEYKDARAPQNLVPVGGLERRLRARLGDALVLQRALAAAAA